MTSAQTFSEGKLLFGLPVEAISRDDGVH
jgi:hypothetical protein